MTEWNLDKEQSRVVEYPHSTICIAGPGSGKTRVLAAKAESLYLSHQDVICLTFTRSAAGEIRDRIPGIPASTIHSFCHSVMGWRSGQTYDDLLVNFLKEGHDHFDWVLVDEFQDLTPTQLSVIFSIVGKNIFVVGDPYQSIYQYGGAMGPEAFDEVKLQYHPRTFQLHNNYRSTPDVVESLNRIYPRGLVSRGSKVTGLTSILTRTNDQVRELHELLRDWNLGHLIRSGSKELGTRKEEDFGNPGLQISTIHMAKGLEFDYVMLWNWEPSWHEEDQNLYYVANSRASRAFLKPVTQRSLESYIKTSVPNWEDLPYKGKARGTPTAIYSIVINPDWYTNFLPFLETASSNKNRSIRTLARTTLGRLKLGQRYFSKGESCQISLTSKEAEFLVFLSRELEMKDAEERLGIGL